MFSRRDHWQESIREEAEKRSTPVAEPGIRESRVPLRFAIGPGQKSETDFSGSGAEGYNHRLTSSYYPVDLPELESINHRPMD